MNNLSDIEQLYEFEYPDIYRQLANDGMVYFGEKGQHWHTEYYPKLKENPPLLLELSDFEGLNFPDKVETHLDELQDDYWDVNPDLKLVPFGQSGAGDYFCFVFGERDPNNPENVPIANVWHDSDKMDFIAKNLQDFVFAKILREMTTFNNYRFKSYEDYRQRLQAMLNTHQKYLTDEQNTILNQYVNAEAVEYSFCHSMEKGLLTHDQYQQILKQTIDFDKFNQSICYKNS